MHSPGRQQNNHGDERQDEQSTGKIAPVTTIGPSRHYTEQLLANLTPVQCKAAATAPGFGDATSRIDVVAGQTSSISLTLPATPSITDASRTVYRDANGALIALEPNSLQAGQFIFYAWLQDRPTGIDPAVLAAGTASDPGRPLLTEQTGTAPSFTQNLAAAFVGFTDASGVVGPLIGADVRWEIDQFWSGRVNSTQFDTSDDNRAAVNHPVVLSRCGQDPPACAPVLDRFKVPLRHASIRTLEELVFELGAYWGPVDSSPLASGEQMNRRNEKGGTEDGPQDWKRVPIGPDDEGLWQAERTSHPRPKQGPDEAQGDRDDEPAANTTREGLAHGAANGRDDDEKEKSR